MKWGISSKGKLMITEAGKAFPLAADACSSILYSQPLTQALRVVTIMFSCGDIYSGSLKEGLFCGDGIYTFANGDVQNGRFFNGNLEGSGSYTWNNSTRYEGLFSSGQMHGCGTLQFSSGNRLSGVWKNGLLQQGTFFTAVRDCCFAGSYEQGLRSGFGSETFKDGASFEGEYVRGLLHGFGILSLADGTVYEGAFAEGDLQGQGKLQHPSLGSFIGEFSQCRQHGSGVRSYSNGDTFTGTFAAGAPILGVFQRVSDGAELHISQSDRDQSSRHVPAVTHPHSHLDARAAKVFGRRVRSPGVPSPRRRIDRSLGTPSLPVAAVGASPRLNDLPPETPIRVREELGDASFTVLATPTWV
jgi:hypothetical protein